MTYQLKDAKITHLSLVDKGANGVPFAIVKQAGKNAIQKQVTIAKVEKAKRIVKGIVYQPDLPDAHDDLMTADEIEKAAHLFMENQHTYNIDKQHDLETDEGFVIESHIAEVDMTLGDQDIKKGSWIAAVKVTSDDTWEQIEKGEITGFSMWGVGKREKVDDTPSATDEEAVEKGLLYAIKKAVGLISKGAVADKYNKNRKNREFWAAQDALNSVLFRWDYWDSGMETDATVIREALEDFVAIAQDVLIQEDIVKAIGKPPEPITKAGKKISAANQKHIDSAIAALTQLKEETTPKEDDEVKQEDIAKAVTAALTPITKQLQDLTNEVAELKKEAGTEPQGSTEENELTAALSKALEPIAKQVEALNSEVQVIKNARGDSAQPPGEGNIHKSENNLFAGKF